MMRIERNIRAVIFVVFFGVGAAVLAVTVLCDDLLEYFHNRVLLQQAEEHLDRLQSLNADYDALLGDLEADPNHLVRLAPALLGIEPNEPNTVYPRATADKLAAARKALLEEPKEPVSDEVSLQRLEKCCRWPYRHILFFSGAALMLISFIFFGTTGRPGRPMAVTTRNTPTKDK